MSDRPPDPRLDVPLHWLAPVQGWVALLALLGLSLGVAFMRLDGYTLEINLAIAAIMLGLLAIVLMNLGAAPALVRIVAASGLFWMIFFFVLTFIDYLSRHY
jgi:cytochrome c oxidase subunit IV